MALEGTGDKIQGKVREVKGAVTGERATDDAYDANGTDDRFDTATLSPTHQISDTRRHTDKETAS